MHDEVYSGDMLQQLSVTVTEMFRDAHFYRAFATDVIPKLRTYPLLKIWHAGCATGEEPYSMAIMLHEAGLLEHTQIYATDINGKSLTLAERGIYNVADMNDYSRNYLDAGGKTQLSDYYHRKYESAILADFLRKKVLFSDHNLVTDDVFGEMHVVICRNVLIYFDRALQDRALNLFGNSLVNRGFLCLGDKETTNFSAVKEDFETYANKARIYRKLSAKVPV